MLEKIGWWIEAMWRRHKLIRKKIGSQQSELIFMKIYSLKCRFSRSVILYRCSIELNVSCRLRLAFFPTKTISNPNKPGAIFRLGYLDLYKCIPLQLRSFNILD